MVTLGVFFGLLLCVIAAIVWKVGRRGSGPTENIEGLRIEQERRSAADSARHSFNAIAQHDTLPTRGDSYRDKR
ncbi:hypothetical protein AB0E75_20630 [Streptomyces griseoviridis]|jgi:hypothetical protein|uniref:Uncharacterized protein n=1 Tax=Streptomyces griseoviridis TaxID=45398 RepID=A0A918G332_STRGD|nr:hypothetical protein [Streptomyces niveoruber]GGS16351.1 hypothetical protein GCM10010238_00130 [Streptomyces niveoruber]